MDKQGSLMQETPIRLFFIVAGGLIVMATVYMLIAAANEDAEMRICKATLTLQTATDLGPVRDSPLNTQCERRYLEIRENAVIKIREKGIDATIPVWIDGKARPTYKQVNEEIVHSVLAESMRRCWQIGLEGERSVFDEDLFTAETTCLICDQFDVKVEGTYIHDQSFNEYLASTKMPLDERKRTYEDYLFTPKSLELFGRANVITGDRNCVREHGIEENPLITEGTYATILYKHHTATAGGCLATYVVPAAKARTLCEQTVN